MYAAAPINNFFLPKITVSEGESIIEIEITEKLHHAAGGVHGSVYFKMLDDAAFFAANSLEKGNYSAQTILLNLKKFLTGFSLNFFKIQPVFVVA